jgi:hypothetical protein
VSTEPNQGPDRDPVSIGAGIVFFLIGGAYLLASGGHLAVNAGWTLSLLVLGLGLSGVVGAVLRTRRDRANRGDWHGTDF